MLSWDDTRLFLAVARSDTISAAGTKLRIDPATVSRRIARLEETLGTVLFRKSPQGYALTEAGERLWPHIEAAEAALSAGVDAVSERASGMSGQIRVGAPDGCANFVLPQVCAEIAKANPDLDIQIIALPRMVNLTRREADMAIAVSPPTGGRLTVQKITDYSLHLAAHRDLLHANPVRDLDDLKHHPTVGYIPDMIFDRELDYQDAAGGGRVALASNSVAVQLNLLRQRAGVGFVHDFALPAAPELEPVLTQTIALTRSFYLIRHEDDARLDRSSRLAALLLSGIRQEIARLEAECQINEGAEVSQT